MASIRKRDNGQWRARYRDETGKEHARHFARKVDAQRWLDAVTASVVRGDYVDPAAGRITFRQWFAEWSQRQVWARGTLEAAQQAADSATFSDIPLKNIRRSHVEQWVKAMSQPARSRRAGLAATTVRTRYNYVHMAFRAAVKDHVIREDPSADVALPKARRAEAAMTIPSPEQVGAALTATQSQPFHAFIAVCAFAGLRLGEAAGLQVDDVDFLRRTITVRRQVQGQTSRTTEAVAPKHGSERVVFIPEGLTEVLATHIQDVGVWGDQQWLFGSGGCLLNRNSAGNLWRSTRAAAGLDGFTLHSLRHFFASGLIAAGCDVVTVQSAMGHSDPTITLKVYSHLWPKAEDRTRAAAADLMAAAVADSLRTEATNQAADLA